MTDEQITALVERLRGHSKIMSRDKGKFVRFIDVATCNEAADLIETLTDELERLREEPTLTITRAQYVEFVESAEDHTILWTDTLSLIGVYVAPCQTKNDVQHDHPNKGNDSAAQ